MADVNAFIMYLENAKIIHFLIRTKVLKWKVTLFGICNSLVPRPHPFMRINGLVNQVKFLGLVHTFGTVLPRNDQKILHQTCSKMYRYSSRFFFFFYCCKGSVCNNY